MADVRAAVASSIVSSVTKGGVLEACASSPVFCRTFSLNESRRVWVRIPFAMGLSKISGEFASIASHTRNVVGFVYFAWMVSFWSHALSSSFCKMIVFQCILP